MKPSKLSEVTDHQEFEIFGVNPLECALVLRLDECFQVIDDTIGRRVNTERKRIAFNKTPNHTLISHSGWGLMVVVSYESMGELLGRGRSVCLN
jgi:hypothetical protein